MIDISKRSYLKYLLFACLYFSEGLQVSTTSVVIPIYFLEKGFSLPVTTLVVGIASIPWVIKFVFGGVVDYFIRFGRKRFILLGGVLVVIGFFAVAFIDPVVALIPFTVFLFVARGGSALLDVSADAWAIEISREEERGKINSGMFGGMFIGSAVAAPLFFFIANILRYSIAFVTAGLITVLILIFPLVVKEVKIIKKRQKVGKILINEFKKRTTQLLAILGPFLGISIGLLMIVVPLYLYENTSLQLDIVQIGLITSVFPISTVFGALIAGPISDKWDRKIILCILILAGIFFSASLIFAYTWLILAILYGILGFLRGGYYVVLSAMFMDVTNPRVGATQFSILTSLTNFGLIAIGFILTGSLVAMLGFDRVFLFTAWFLGPALLILYFVRIKHQKSKLSD